MTKKTSTPTKPPETVPKPEWATMTSRDGERAQTLDVGPEVALLLHLPRVKGGQSQR